MYNSAQLTHSVFTQLENSYITMLFVDFSSTFNTISPIRLIGKLNTLSLSTTLCTWISEFLSSRPQTVWLGIYTCATVVLNTGAPQGCLLSLLLFTLYTHDLTPRHQRMVTVNSHRTAPPWLLKKWGEKRWKWINTMQFNWLCLISEVLQQHQNSCQCLWTLCMAENISSTAWCTCKSSMWY